MEYQYHFGWSVKDLALVKKYVNASKHEPSVEEAELMHATPSYAYISFTNGIKTKVSPGDVALLGDQESFLNECDEVDFNLERNKHFNLNNLSNRSCNSKSGGGNIDVSISKKFQAKKSLVESP